MMRIHKRQLFVWMQKHPLLGRVFAFAVLVFFPAIIIPLVLWHERDWIVSAWAETIATVFGRWEDD